MFALAAFAQANAIEVTFFERPSHRSQATRRRVASFIRTIRSALARAADEPASPPTPRLTKYPY